MIDRQEALPHSTLLPISRLQYVMRAACAVPVVVANSGTDSRKARTSGSGLLRSDMA
ncbi:hypothetical protein GCM10009733_056150 [Nonomuraea maheshkhaliensis]|uniref:Uncharacterized protein n=1 Tax=Nonomuraea maheshkhaliensis TaxID=419590 RepID=A0ABN2FLB0_9ACTN